MQKPLDQYGPESSAEPPAAKEAADDDDDFDLFGSEVSNVSRAYHVEEKWVSNSLCTSCKVVWKVTCQELKKNTQFSVGVALSVMCW